MRWMLPDGVEEWLPPDSWRLDAMRREVLDTFARHGFELVLPPVLEYTDSLHSGVGRDLELRTFAVTDQTNGRRLGLRADITPQAARIDANRYADDARGVRRLCYLGTVLRTHPEVPGGPRSLRQLGAEIFGAPQLDADIEVISLMCEILLRSGNGGGGAELTLDLGHVGVVRALLPADLREADSEGLRAAIQRKAPGEIRAQAQNLGLEASAQEALVELATWHGPPEHLEGLRPQAPPACAAAIDELLELSRRLRERLPRVAQHLDCGELTGFHYHTGVTWAAYRDGRGQALARGGRYDGIGRVFGAARPATGFSADLNGLLPESEAPAGPAEVVQAPCGDDAALLAVIRELRNAGRRVLQRMPDEDFTPGPRLCRDGDDWIITDSTS